MFGLVGVCLDCIGCVWIGGSVFELKGVCFNSMG